MISKKFFWAMVVVFAVAAAVVVYIFVLQIDSVTAPTTTGAKSSATVGEKNLPKPTGNIDDITKDLLSGASGEQEMSIQEDSDKAFIDGDIEIINEFGQSYNENEL